MKKFLAICGLFSILCLAAGSYEASAKVKLKIQEKTVLQVGDHILVIANFREAVTPACPILEEISVYSNLNPRPDHSSAILEPEGFMWRQQTYGDNYLHRSQAWLKIRNLDANAKVNTFGTSTESGYSPLLC